MERIGILCSTLPSQSTDDLGKEIRGRAYLMAVQSCEKATLEDLDEVLGKIIAGLPTPLKFAPTSGQFALLVRDQAAKRLWIKQGGNVKLLDHATADLSISPEEQKRRQKILEKLSDQLADVTTARKM